MKEKTNYVRWLLCVLFLTCPAQAKYGGGTGEPNDPYLIYTAEQMNAIGIEPNNWDKHFKLMADIDLSTYTGDQFNIIGGNPPFTGVFDGDGHTISNFTYASTDQWCGGGLFGSVNDPNAEIKNLRLIDPNVVTEDGYGVGLLIAGLSQGIISNCHVENGHVAGFGAVGGLIGDISGVVQITRESIIRYGGGILRNCTTNCINVSGGRQVGGLVGDNRGTITDCYSTGTVFGNEHVGGLVGESYGTITNCFSAACVAGDGPVGGLIGYNSAGSNGRIMHCCSSGSVSGNWAVGGLVGMNATRISNCYSTGDVIGNEYVGGLVGSNSRRAWIGNCYSIGRVTGDAEVGGLVGSDYEDGDHVMSSFWAIETSGQTASDGGIGKTSAEMQTSGTFLEAGWDFVDETTNGTEDIWWILEGLHYPRLWWHYLAFSPYPEDGATDVAQPLILHWKRGRSALYHDVYFGKSKEAVANATTERPDIYRGRQAPEMTTYDPGILGLAKTHYWRIDEVNEADPNSTWKGNIWSFTTGDFLVVDDFEDYDAGDNQIWYAWKDGLGYGRLGDERYYPGNRTGSEVWNINALWEIEHIVHGGFDAMVYFYYNNKEDFAKYSEAEKTLSYPRDWTEEGIEVLSLWFYGNPANAPEPMYVAVANTNGQTAVVLYHDNPNSVLMRTWTEWTIDLQEFADQGVNLTDVNSIAIGFGDRNNPQPGGSGRMYFDDIRLCRLLP